MGFFSGSKWAQHGSTVQPKKGGWCTRMSFIHIDHMESDCVDQVMAPLYGVADMYVRKATDGEKPGCQTRSNLVSKPALGWEAKPALGGGKQQNNLYRRNHYWLLTIDNWMQVRASWDGSLRMFFREIYHWVMRPFCRNHGSCIYTYIMLYNSSWHITWVKYGPYK